MYKIRVIGARLIELVLYLGVSVWTYGNLRRKTERTAGPGVMKRQEHLVPAESARESKT